MRILKKILITALLLFLFFFLFNFKVVSKSEDFSFKGDFKKDELLVKFKDKEEAGSLLKSLGIQGKAVTKTGVYRIKLPENKTIEETYQELKKNPNISYVEPNYQVKITATPNDTYYSSQWALPKINAPTGWNRTQGSSDTKIAIIDTGVDYNHEDLQSKIWINTGETASNGLDDDSNGYIDDRIGFDFYNGTLEDPFQSFDPVTNKWINDADSAMDDHAHGTSVAGIAAALTNNSLGVAGIDWNAKIVPLKVLDQSGNGYVSDIISALEYAADNNIDIANMSLGTYSFSQSFQDIIDYAYNQGVILVAAAGNDDINQILYPARFSNVLAVGATNSSDQRITKTLTGGSWGSNYGPELDVTAPGISLYSTDRTGGVGYSSGNYFSGFGGTSGATPHVAGLAGLIKAAYPSLTNTQIYDRIKNSAYDLGSTGFDQYYGYGRINAENALSLGVEVSSSLSLNPSSMVVGGENTVSFIVHNYSSSPITYKALGVAVRLNEPAWNPQDFDYDTNVTIPADGDYAFTKSKTFTEEGSYRMWVAAYTASNQWIAIGSSLGVTTQITKQAAMPDLRVSTSLARSPSETPGLGQEMTFTFSVKNYSSSQVTLSALGIATRLNEPSWNPRDFGYKTVTINAGATYNYSETTYFTELGSYRSFIASLIGSYWYNIPADLGQSSQITYSVGYPNVKISTSLSISPPNPSIGEQATVSFQAVNNSQSPVHFPALGVAVRLNEPAWNPRDLGYEIVTIGAGQIYAYTRNPVFTETGSYRAWVAYFVGGAWRSLEAEAGKTNTTTWLVSSFPDLRVSTSLARSPSETPGLGQEITFTFSVKNYSSSQVTLSALCIATRLNEPAWNPRDFGCKNNIAINSGAAYNYSETIYFTELGSYRSFVTSFIGGKWFNIPADSGQANQVTFSVGLPNVKVKVDPGDGEGDLEVNPSVPMAGSSAILSFKVYNYAASAVHLPVLGVAVRLNEPAWDPKDPGYENATINPASYYSYSKTLNIGVNDTGNWRAWVAYYIGGVWRDLTAESPASAQITFYSYLETATLEGVPLPANSGKTAWEQHLSLSECQESPGTHYSLSATPLMAQNGMAWQTSGGCGYGAWGVAPPVNDERYYIAMRWNYTNLHGQPIYASKSWYYKKKAVVTNPSNGKKVIVSIIEYGPSPSTGRVSGLSPEAALALNAVTDDTLNYSWLANQSLDLIGPIS